MLYCSQLSLHTYERMLEAELIAFGLSPRQVKVYLALIQIEEGSARRVAEHANLPRLTVYSILERLITMGLVSFYEKRNVRTYQVNPPDSLLGFCDRELSQIQVKRQRLERSLPQLRSFFKHPHVTLQAGGSQGFRFFQDRALFQNRCRSLLRKSGKGWVIHDGALWPLLSELNGMTPTLFRCLLPSSQRGSISHHVKGIDLRYIPECFWKENVNAILVSAHLFLIFEDSFHFLAVEIDHPSIIESISALVAMLWSMSSEREGA